MKTLILASASPRRIEMLKKWGFKFKSVKAIFREKTFPSPEKTALYNAYGKAFSVAKTHKQEVVIGADTIVVIENKILGKPEDKKELNAMLNLLSGKTHYVITGLAVIKGENFATDLCKTEVGFRELSKREIEEYIESREGEDKAGGYAVQGIGASFINKINGPLDNVIGLPVNTLRELIKKIER